MNGFSHRPASSLASLIARLFVALAYALLLTTTPAKADPAPTITSFSPTQGVAGSTVVTIYGTGFEAPLFAHFFGTAFYMQVNVVSPTELTVTVPPSALTGPIGIGGANGNTGTPTDFVVTGRPPIETIPSFEVFRARRDVVLGSGHSDHFILETPMAGSKDVWLNYALSGNAVNGQDYQLRSGRVLVKARVGQATIKITPRGDLGGAASRTVKFTLLPGEGYLVAQRNTSRIRIVADR